MTAKTHHVCRCWLRSDRCLCLAQDEIISQRHTCRVHAFSNQGIIPYALLHAILSRSAFGSSFKWLPSPRLFSTRTGLVVALYFSGALTSYLSLIPAHKRLGAFHAYQVSVSRHRGKALLQSSLLPVPDRHHELNIKLLLALERPGVWNSILDGAWFPL